MDRGWRLHISAMTPAASSRCGADLVDRRATRDGDGLAADVARLLAGQEDERRGELDGLAGGLPAPGDVVRLGERAVGAVTSVARHHELGPVALALVKRQVPDDADLLAGPVAARLEADDAPTPVRAARPELMRFRAAR